MRLSPFTADIGYTSPHWAKGCDKAALLASARKSEPNWSDANIERLAMAGSMVNALFTPTRRLANAGRIVGAEAVAGALTEVHGDPMLGRRAA